MKSLASLQCSGLLCLKGVPRSVFYVVIAMNWSQEVLTISTGICTFMCKEPRVFNPISDDYVFEGEQMTQDEVQSSEMYDDDNANYDTGKHVTTPI